MQPEKPASEEAMIHATLAVILDDAAFGRLDDGTLAQAMNDLTESIRTYRDARWPPIHTFTIEDSAAGTSAEPNTITYPIRSLSIEDSATGEDKPK